MAEAYIEQWYLGLLGRPALAAEMAQWQGSIAAGGSFEAVRDALAASAEFQAVVQHGNEYLLNWVYTTLFGRTPDSDGRAFWTAALTAGQVTPVSVVESIMTGAQGADPYVLRDKLIAAEVFTAASALRENLPLADPAPDGAVYLAAVVDNVTLNTAFDHVYEQMTDGVGALFPYHADQHLAVQTGSALVEAMYLGFLGRPADVAGLQFWDKQQDAGLGVAALRTAFAASDEFQAATAGRAEGEVVDLLYQNLFGRTAEADGKAFWTHGLETGAVTVAGLTEALLAGAVGADAEALRAKIIAASSYTAVLPVVGDMMTLLPVPPAVPGHDFVAAVTDDASLNTALDQLYESIRGDTSVHLVGVLPAAGA